MLDSISLAHVRTSHIIHNCVVIGSLQEFYFKCANHSTSDTDVCVALHMVRANTLDVDCASCLAAQ